MKLPEFLHFFRLGWWVLHLLAVPGFVAAGAAVGLHLSTHGAGDTHTGHDHSSSDALRGIMRPMLVDLVKLRAGLQRGDFKTTAADAGHLAEACDNTDPHTDIPAAWGNAFVRFDEALHGSAAKLRDAAAAGNPEEARAQYMNVVRACTGCHAQAPAASKVDLEIFAQGFAPPTTP